MFSYKYEFDKNDLESFKKAMKESIGKEKYIEVADKSTVSFYRDIVEKTPSKQGNTRRSWSWSRVGEFARMIFSKSPINTYLEDGTRAHDIYPKNKKALAWPGKSSFSVETIRTTNKLTGKALKRPVHENFTFRKHVHHPGTKAVDMVKSSMPDFLMTWSYLVKKMLEDIWSTK